MSRVPSLETRFKNLQRSHTALGRELNTAKLAAESYRIRATKAEQECAEWRRRFDALLARDERQKP